jgi:hypothetical protein
MLDLLSQSHLYVSQNLRGCNSRQMNQDSKTLRIDEGVLSGGIVPTWELLLGCSAAGLFLLSCVSFQVA